MTHIKKLFLTLSLLAMQSAFGMDDIREGSYPYKYFPRPEKPPILTLAKYYPPIWSAPQSARPFNRRLTLEETRVLQLATQHTPVWVAAPAEPFDLALRPPEDMRLLNFSPAQEPRSSRYNNSHFTLAEIRQTKALFLRYLKMEPISFRLCQLTPKEQIRYINNHSKSL
ncbi:MAG TPA: hypothetical protein VLH77_06170, partial [Gammaproteobacteria bacterium]|nr:hypothetical protein [Gammaproteobacteria bacterium]